MSGLDWTLAGVAIFVWIGCYVYFFSGNIRRWIQQRPTRRAMAREAAAARAAEQARLADELAAKYPLPPSVATQPRTGEG